MKTIKLKNVALFAFAFAATAFVSSCSSDDDADNNINIDGKTAITLKVGVTDAIADTEDAENPVETRAALLKKAYSPIQEMNIPAGDGLTLKGAQLVDETLVEAATRADTNEPMTAKEITNGTSITVYYYGGANTADENYLDKETVAVNNGEITITPVANTRKLILLVGTEIYSTSATFSNATVKEVIASSMTSANSTISTNTNFRRGLANNMERNSDYTAYVTDLYGNVVSKNKLELACKYNGVPTKTTTLYFTRLAARIRTIFREYQGSTYDAGDGWKVYPTNWALTMTKGGQALAMQQVQLTAQTGNAATDVTQVPDGGYVGYSSENSGGFNLCNLAYYHSALSGKDEDRAWYEAQRDAPNANAKFAIDGKNATNTWKGTDPDKFDVWYNIRPNNATSFLFDYFYIKFNDSVSLTYSVSAGTVPRFTMNYGQTLKPGHSYTFIFYVYINSGWKTEYNSTTTNKDNYHKFGTYNYLSL